MSKPMNEHDLTKWKNKFRLWQVLHPDIKSPVRCAVCLNRAGIAYQKGQASCCPKVTLGFNYSGEVREFFGPIAPYDWFCIEWIKYV